MKRILLNIKDEEFEILMNAYRQYIANNTEFISRSEFMRRTLLQAFKKENNATLE